jgi:TolB-like protein
MPQLGFLSELIRRNVYRVAVAYLVCGWLLLQVADMLFPALKLPGWSITLVVALLVIGFIPALIFSWAYESTPEGVKPQSEVDIAHSSTPQTGRRLNLITIAMLLLGTGVVLTDHFLLDRATETKPPIAIDLPSDKPRTSTGVAEDSIPFLAILPFKAIGSDNSSFLAGGLHDDLLTRLAKLGAFKVISRTSMMEYTETTKNMRQIGEELGADYILEGSVQAMGNRVRINAQLIDARIDEHLWAENYDRDLTATDLFDIQAELAVAIAGQLQTTLSDSAHSIAGEIPTENTEAYTAYLHALSLGEQSYTAANQAKIEAALEEAVRLDPEFALAWAHLSVARNRSAAYTTDAESRESKLAAAFDALARARSLRPDLLESELARIQYLRSLSQYEQALEAIEALGGHGEVDADALLLKSSLYGSFGRYQEAYQAALAAQRLAPRNIGVATTMIFLSMWNKDCESAGWHAKIALSLAPDDPDVRSDTAWYELQCTGNAKRASDLLRGVDLGSMHRLYTARLAARVERDYVHLLELSRIPISGPWSILSVWRLLVECEALRLLGRDQEATATLARAEDVLATLESDGTAFSDEWYPLTKAFYYSMAGDQEATRRWIEKDRQRYREEAKNLGGLEVEALFNRAHIFAIAGLNKEAIDSLRLMFENPGGGYTFRFVDSIPWFDDLKDNTGYAELRDQYGDEG